MRTMNENSFIGVEKGRSIMSMFRVVETDNFGRDYPNESFAGPRMSREDANRVADIFNAAAGNKHPRFWKVEPVTYRLQPGFAP